MPATVPLSEVYALASELLPGSMLAIEGFSGAGKTTLADSLATAHGAHAVHLDKFVMPGDVAHPYADRLDLQALASALRSSEATLLIVDGICLREVMHRLGLSPSVYVYVKRISAAGLWNDGIDLEYYEAGDWTSPGEPQASDMAYHAAFRPHEKANVVVHRHETSGAA